MNDRKGDMPTDVLREKAERCFRLAYETTDQRVRDLLNSYGHELLEQADALTRD